MRQGRLEPVHVRSAYAIDIFFYMAVPYIHKIGTKDCNLSYRMLYVFSSCFAFVNMTRIQGYKKQVIMIRNTTIAHHRPAHGTVRTGHRTLKTVKAK